MLKVDHRKMLKHLYSASKTAPAILEIPPMNFLMIDGKGRPPEKDFQEAVSTLYPVAYTLKFMVRANDDVDYHVMPLEVIWKVNRQTKDFAWTMLVMQPEYVTGDLYGEVAARVQAKNEPPCFHGSDSSVSPKERACNSCTRATTRAWRRHLKRCLPSLNKTVMLFRQETRMIFT